VRYEARCTIPVVGRRVAVTVVTLAALALVSAGTAQGSSMRAEAWAFPAHQVLVKQGLLRRVLNDAFSSVAPIEVHCRGLHPVALASGGRGFLQIRCTTSLNIPDFIYHLDSRGKQYVTRSW
jgi:hypothetical protein